MPNNIGVGINGGLESLGKYKKQGGVKINGVVGISKKKRGKRFKVEHKGSFKLGITALGQPGQVQCGNGSKNIPARQSY